MSWTDRLKDTPFQITTGDGKIWSPKWVPTTKSVEFNHSIYDYPELRGSFIDRREAKSEKFNFEILYDGDNAIDNGEAFLVSSKNKAPWTISHPYYGTRTVQPIRLTVDNSEYNAYKIKIECIETLGSDQPQVAIDPPGELKKLKSLTDDAVAVGYSKSIVTPTTEDAKNLEEAVTIWDKIQSTSLKTTDELSSFKEEVNSALNDINNISEDVEGAIRGTNTLLNYPFRVADTLTARFSGLVEAYQTILSNLTQSATLSPLNKKDKAYFENMAASIISTACLISMVQPEPENREENEDIGEDDYNLSDDYPTRASIIDQIDRLNELYRDLKNTLDGFTSERADDVESYTPDPDTAFNLERTVDFAIHNLESQIFGASQERLIILPEETDIINLTHKLVGLDQEDKNIDRLFEINGLGLNHMLTIPKGTTIKYYV